MDNEMTSLIRENERLKAGFTLLLALYEDTVKQKHSCVVGKEEAELILKVIGMQPKELDVINFEAVEVDG